MQVTAMEILHGKREVQHSFGLDRLTRDALAAYARLRWPSGAAKHAAREWGLSVDEARGVVAARASLATIDRIWKHPAGGWAVLFPVMGAVIGQTAEDFLQHERKRHAELARRHGTLVRDLRAGPAVRDRPRHELDVWGSEDRRSVDRNMGQGADQQSHQGRS